LDASVEHNAQMEHALESLPEETAQWTLCAMLVSLVLILPHAELKELKELNASMISIV